MVRIHLIGPNGVSRGLPGSSTTTAIELEEKRTSASTVRILCMIKRLRRTSSSPGRAFEPAGECARLCPGRSRFEQIHPCQLRFRGPVAVALCSDYPCPELVDFRLENRIVHATRRCPHLLAVFATGFIALFAKPLAAPHAPLIVDRHGHEIVFRSHRRQPVVEMQNLVLAHDEPQSISF